MGYGYYLTVGGVSVAGFRPGFKDIRCQQRRPHRIYEGGSTTFGRGGTTHSLCVTTPAGLGASWLITLVARGARVGGPGLQADTGEEIAANSQTGIPSDRLVLRTELTDWG